MPVVKRGATLFIEQGIDLPMNPPIAIAGKGLDGKVVCHLSISATEVEILGPKHKILAGFH